ncbi:unnamed protein product [Haemonchus placei]|uniref:Secreted protein n=1 Tax=Haemonchus placei TaxID=6290 RepID=A0A0N4WMW6_HAEPC|nr:unnamed protein product [Haemonchus placei]
MLILPLSCRLHSVFRTHTGSTFGILVSYTHALDIRHNISGLDEIRMDGKRTAYRLPPPGIFHQCTHLQFERGPMLECHNHLDTQFHRIFHSMRENRCPISMFYFYLLTERKYDRTWLPQQRQPSMSL